MTTFNNNDEPIITCGAEGKTYLCADLKQVQKGSVYEIKLKSDNSVIDTVAIQHPDIEVEAI